MNDRYLQIVEHNGENYKPVVRFGGWRVAVLNYHSRFHRQNINQMERHLLTDETFALLKGQAALYIADGDGSHIGHIEAIPLEFCKVYNVRQGVWHAIEVSENASVLITENDDTSLENSPKLRISPDDLPTWCVKGRVP